MSKLKLSELDILESQAKLAELPQGKLLINTINAHSFNTAQKDSLFSEALKKGDVLIPDGASIVKACKWIGAKSQPKERIAGWDLFSFEMEKLERMQNAECRMQNRRKAAEGKANYSQKENNAQPNSASCILNSALKRRVMFMGSSQKVLDLIVKKAAEVYPHLEIVTYSPPYKPEFSDEDNAAIIKAINDADPDLLWIGMTAPKQEKWTYSHWSELNIHCHVGTVGAVFDFFAGTYQRAPQWWQDHSLEWLYRLIKEPKRMWRRYVLGNPLFLYNIAKERFSR